MADSLKGGGNRQPTFDNDYGRVIGYWSEHGKGLRCYTEMAGTRQFGWCATIDDHPGPDRNDPLSCRRWRLRWRLRFVSGDMFDFGKYVEVGDGYQGWYPTFSDDKNWLIALAELAVRSRAKMDDYIEPNFTMKDIAARTDDWRHGYRIGHRAGWDLQKQQQFGLQREKLHQRAGLSKSGEDAVFFCGKTGGSPTACECQDTDLVWLGS